MTTREDAGGADEPRDVTGKPDVTKAETVAVLSDMLKRVKTHKTGKNTVTSKKGLMLRPHKEQPQLDNLKMDRGPK